MDEAERLRRELQREVEILERLNARLRSLLQTRGASPELTSATDEASGEVWRQSRGLEASAATALAGLRSGDASFLPWVVAYIEVDPWYPFSGYMKGDLMRQLRKFDIESRQADRLRAAILGNLSKGRRLEFGEVRKLARRLDTAAFRRELAKRLQEGDADTRERAQLLLDACALNDYRQDLRSAR